MKISDKYKTSWETAVIIMALAWPTIVEQVMQTAVQYIDTAMVGSLGTQATAAVGATSTINWLVMGTITAISIGFLSYIARAIGADDYKLAKKYVAQSVFVTLVVGVVSTAILTLLSYEIPLWMQVDKDIAKLAGDYFLILYSPMLFRTASIILGTVLRAAGDTKTPMRVGIIVNIINIVLNFLLIYPTNTYFGITIFGAGLGVIGAAIASSISFVVGGLLIALEAYRHPLVSFKGLSLKPDKAILIPCMKIAIPNMLQRFTTSLGYVVFASMINSIGEIATAAHTIANTVESAFYIPGYGMQTAAATLVGNAYGAQDKKKMKDLAKMFVPIEVFLMILSGGALFITATPLMKIFSSDANVISLGSTVLKMVALSEPFYGAFVIVEGMMMGVGKTKEPFIFSVVGMWGVRIVGTFICTQMLGMGLVSAWACMIAHNLLLFVLYMIVYKTGSWNPLNKELSA